MVITGMMYLFVIVGSMISVEAQLELRYDELSPSLNVSFESLWEAGPMTDANLMANHSMGHWLVPSTWPNAKTLGWDVSTPYSNPFTRQMSTVRLLGGWATHTVAPMDPRWFDVVYRDKNGKLVYRWDALWDRLDPMVNNSVRPVVVLDNVPFALAQNGGEESVYGQVLGPANNTEYGEFIKELASGIVDHYGMDTVKEWTWRVATEPNTRPGHWNSTNEAWMEMYDFAVYGLRQVLPEASVGPGNFCPYNFPGMGCWGTLETEVEPIVDHIAAGKSYATGKVGETPISFLASSIYGSYDPHGNLSYDAALGAVSALGMLGLVDRHKERLGGIPMAFMEYGTLGNEWRNISGEPGTFGGAYKVASSAAAAAWNVTSMFHWGDIEMSLSSSQDPNPYEYLLLQSAMFPAIFANAAKGGRRPAVLSIPVSSEATSPKNILSSEASSPKNNLFSEATSPKNSIPSTERVPISATTKCPAATIIPTKTPGVSVCVNPETDSTVTAAGFAVFVPEGAGAGFGYSNSLFALVSTFSPTRTLQTTSTVNLTLSIPPEWLRSPPSSIKAFSTQLNRSTSVYDAIHDYGLSRGWLESNNSGIYSLGDMLNHYGLDQAKATRDTWIDMQSQFFTPTPSHFPTICSTKSCTTIITAPAHSITALWLTPEKN